MKILLTGATGQIGWELARLLPGLGEVTMLDRGRLDLADPDATRAVVERIQPDVLVNAAAYTAVDRAEADVDQVFRINADAVEVMARAMVRKGGLIMHYSTDYVFDGRPGRPFKEDDPTGPLNRYGESKLAGERALRASGVGHLNFRTSWIYASRGRNFLLTMLRLAKERDELRVVDDQIGAPTWARYVAQASCEALRQCLLLSEPNSRSGTYHLTAAGQTTWFGFLQAILSARNGGSQPARPRLTPIASTEYPVAARRPQLSVLDNGKLHRSFGIEQVPWQSMLECCLAEVNAV